MKTALEFPTKLGEFDVDADGFLSSDGQDLFPTYGASGGLTCRTVRYRLVAEETSDESMRPKKGIRRSRSKPRPGRKKGKAMAAMRAEVFERDGGLCACGKPGTDLAHKRNKRMWGDSPENTEVECRECHRIFHAYGPSRTKPCPPKEKSLEQN